MYVIKEKFIHMQYLHQDKGFSFNQIMRRLKRWKGQLIITFSTSELKSRGGRRNLQIVMKVISYVQYTVWEFPLDLSPPKHWHPCYSFSLDHKQSTQSTWLPLSTSTQERYVHKQRRSQKIEVCSTNETLITLLLEMLHKFLL